LFTLKKVVGEFAAKCLNPDMGGLSGRAQISIPRPDFDFTLVKFEVCPSLSIELGLWRHPCQRRRIIDPQSDALPSVGQKGTQAPTHPQISMVVDDAAKNVPKHA
jgi:hypothetical protein